jgi:tetratricopeptide (TPR) repeat protein
MTMPSLIAQIEPPHAAGGGDHFYRAYAPGLAMAQVEGVYVVTLTSQHRQREEIAAEADVLILDNICDPDFLPCIQKRREQRKQTFYEIPDDLKAIPSWNPVHFFFRNTENQNLYKRLAGSCDGLQFTCKRLEELYGHLNACCRVFPNQVLELPPERSFRPPEQITIGWGGSHGHLEDLADIAEALTQWIITQPRICLHLMCSDSIWDLFQDLPPEKKRRTPTGTIADYYHFLSQIDLGIIHLKDTPYNRARSDIKFIEHAASGVVSVIKRLDPYNESVKHGETALLYDDNDQAIASLQALTENWVLVKKIGREAREYVRHHRMQNDHAHERLTFYTGNLQQNKDQALHSIHVGECFERWSRLEGAVIKGRYMQLNPSRFEHLLHDGLVVMQIHKDKILAQSLFEAAGQLEPRNYLPRLFGAEIALNPVEKLLEALALKPDSLRAWIMLGEQFVQHTKIKEAFESFEKAAKIYPEYEIPYLRAAELLDRMGQKAEARKLYDRVTELLKKNS